MNEEIKNKLYKLIMEGGVYSKVDGIDDGVMDDFSSRFIMFDGLDLYCPQCKDNKSYVYAESNKNKELGTYLSNYSVNGCLLSLVYVCPTCKEKLYLLFLYKNNSIIKLAQLPSLYDVSRDELKKYQKNNLIDKDSFSEIYKADICASQSYNVAAYTYLRRVFENILKNVFKDHKSEIGISNEDFIKLPMDEKLKLIKPFFAIEDDIYKPLYSLLSQGIHALTEEECRENYNLLKAIIVDILVEEKAKKERNENRKMIKELLSQKKASAK
jgi:hypothetical protein